MCAYRCGYVCVCLCVCALVCMMVCDVVCGSEDVGSKGVCVWVCESEIDSERLCVRMEMRE